MEISSEPDRREENSMALQESKQHQLNIIHSRHDKFSIKGGLRRERTRGSRRNGICGILSFSTFVLATTLDGGSHRRLNFVQALAVLFKQNDQVLSSIHKGFLDIEGTIVAINGFQIIVSVRGQNSELVLRRPFMIMDERKYN